MLGFAFGVFIGACATLVLLLVIRERHEWITNTCSRCGHRLDDWGPHL